MTEKQIELIWKFFKNPIICLDGDISGQKAAVRAAEKLFPIMRADSNIYFLTLPENLDPDSYINQKGKDSFTKLAQSKIDIKEFIWNSYYGEINNKDPQSLALFEKKIKSLCREVKDKTLAKYFFDSFMRRIDELTPHSNFKRNNFLRIKKISNPLQQTKEIYKQMNRYEEKELKEFSILFLIMKNLDLFRKNIELISEINFLTDEMNLLKQKLIDYILSEKFFDKKEVKIDDFDKKFKNIIGQINDNAPIKIIHKNKSDADIILMFNEILKEIKKIELKKKIESLEDKVSLNLDENLYTELLTLRNQLKGG
jgi:DNA primase